MELVHPRPRRLVPFFVMFLLIAAVIAPKTAFASSQATITPSGADTTTKSDDPGGCYGGDTFIEALRDSDQPGSRQFLGFTWFDVASNVPLGSNIISASLMMYDTQGAGGDNITFLMGRVESPWSESTLNWSTNPVVTSYTDSKTFNPSNTGYHEWNVTSDVQAFVSGEAVNYGWCLSISAGGWATFASKEGDPNNYPKLIVTWQLESYGERVEVSSNSSILSYEFAYPTKAMSFNVTGPNGTTGYIDVVFETVLLGGPYTVHIDGSPITPIITYNETRALFHIEYSHSTHTIQIVGTTVLPEFPLTLVASVFIITGLLAAIVGAGRNVLPKSRH